MEPVKFPCKSCGATLHFAPGQDALVCPFCGAANDMPEVDVAVQEEALQELDFHAYLSELASGSETVVVTVVKCSNCAAETTFDPNITADECAFCGTALIGGQHTERIIKPKALLPFKIADREAHELFRKWLEGLWFAPNSLKQYAHRDEKLDGVYLPHWTFDSDTATDWRGQRGEYYYVTETYTVDGKTQTRQVRKTRWYSRSGHLHHFFDDVLVCATNSLPRKYMTLLEPWDLEALVPYDEAYLSGFKSEAYSVELEPGWGHAKNRIDSDIDVMIRQQIGGDEQRITWKNSNYNDITFKHILLPVWISAYRYNDKVFRFIVNARTGKVQGERPWSWVKIAGVVILAILILALIIYFTK